ncbi:MAG: hypothetical protein ABL890_02900 [Candidatus Peribacteraceae bacterium]
MPNTQPKSMLSRQILGAGIGMLAAGVVYLAIEHISTQSLSGLLVGTSTISENAHQVRVNKYVDEGSLRKLQTNARMLEIATKEASGVTEDAPMEDTLVARVDARTANRTRRFHDDGSVIASTKVMVADEQVHSGAPKNTGTFVEDAVVRSEPVPTTVETKTASSLPSSGMGTVALLVASSMGAVALRRRARAS